MIKLISNPNTRLEEVLALNNQNTPHVNALSPSDLDELIQASASFQVATDEADQLAGFVLLLREGAAYTSLNYQWFSKTLSEFLYVDRIVVVPEFRGFGVAQLLYDHARAIAKDQAVPWLTCEVNLEPPNPRSLAFHHRQGFEELGQQATEGGLMTVSLLGVKF